MCTLKENLNNAGLFILRVGTGLGMLTHGYQKVFGGIMPKMIEGVTQMGFPAPVVFAWAAALSEFAGAILLVIGLGTRAAAAFICFTMGVAFFVAHRADAFNVKELAFLYMIASGAILLTGPGKWSLDRFVFKCKEK